MTTSILAAEPKRINIGHTTLALYTHGPEPKSEKDPVVFFIPGVASSSLNWAAVVRLLPPSVRSYTYDRSGFRNSDSSTVGPTPERTAQDLSLLLQHQHIRNPLILVGHSWAGVIISEFIALTGNGPHIAGLVLVDANHETALQVLDVNDPNKNAIFAGLDFYEVAGIAAEHKLTPEEWAAFVAEEGTEKHARISEREDQEYAPSFVTLQKKGLAQKQPLLGDKPVYVIGSLRSRDWSRMYEAGVKRGNGTEEQRAFMRDMIATADEKSERLMKEHLKLSRRSRLEWARESGHFIQATQPDYVVDGVKWVLEESRKPI